MSQLPNLTFWGADHYRPRRPSPRQLWAERPPHLSIEPSRGRVLLNAPAEKLLGVRAGQLLGLVQDADAPHEWYLAPGIDHGFELGPILAGGRGQETRLGFYSLRLAAQLLASLPFGPARGGVRLLVEALPVAGADGLSLWPLQTGDFCVPEQQRQGAARRPAPGIPVRGVTGALIKVL